MTCPPEASSRESRDSASPSMLRSALALVGCARPTHTAAPSSNGTSPECPSTPTSENSTTPPHESTSSTAATPANPSPSPENDRERTTLGTSGPSSRDSFAYYDQAASCWRTSQATLLSDSMPSTVTWPRWGMTRGGDAFERPTLVPLTVGTGCSSLLGTPSAADAMGGHLSRGGSRSHELLLKGQVKALLPTPNESVAQDGEKPGTWLERREREKLKGQNGNGMGMPLTIAVQLLPTPGANDHTGAEGPTRHARQEHGTGGPALRDIGHLLPTPTGRDHKGRNQRADDTCLPGAVDRLLPTPTSMDSRASGGSSPSDVTLTDAVVRTSLGARTNPRFDDGNTPSGSPHPGQLTIGDD